MTRQPEKSAVSSYPRPGEVGGRLIRDVVGFLKKQKVSLPFTSHILIGVSGGPDSIALAHLLLKYGRRVAPPNRITLVHIDHGWRGQSRADADFVADFAGKWNVPLILKKLPSPVKNPSYGKNSWEDAARSLRKSCFTELAAEKDAVVLTAHQADDLAETLLWRLFTGAAETHGGGIRFQSGCELRPLLTQRKFTLLKYLQEERQDFVTDETNRDTRFLRAKMRESLLPEIEKIFPKAIEHLVAQGLRAQDESAADVEIFKSLFRAAGLRGRRSHFENLKRGQSTMDLPDGWSLTQQPVSKREASDNAVQERWILERNGKRIGRKSKPL